MNQYAKIIVSTDDGRTDVWEAKTGGCDGCALENGSFVVKKGGAAVGIYSLAHMVSAKIE